MTTPLNRLQSNRVSPPLWILPVIASLVVISLVWPVTPRRPQRVDQAAASFESAASPRADANEDPRRAIWKSDGATVEAVCFSPDDMVMVVTTRNASDAQNQQYLVIEAAEGREVCRLDARHGWPYCFTPSGDTVAVVWRGTISLYDARTGDKRVEINPVAPGAVFEPIQAFAFSPDGRIVIGADRQVSRESLRAWDATTAESLRYQEGQYCWVGGGLAPDGRFFFEGGHTGPTPRIFKSGSRNRLTYCFRDEWSIAALFTPDSRNLVTLHEDGVLVVWELRETGNENARQLLVMPGYKGATSFNIAHSGNMLAVVMDDGSVSLTMIALP
jgi:WD40 repeat protein